MNTIGAEGQYDRLPALARDLIRRQVTVIAATSTPAAMTAKAATFPLFSPPAAIRSTGGNLTGATELNIEVTPKRLEILHELLPTAKLFALLVNPTNPYAEILSRNVQAAASFVGLQLQILHASFASFGRLRSGGLVIGGGEAFLDSRHRQLAALALSHSVPTIYQGRDFALAGGLMSYGGSTLDSYRVAGLYAGRILKGEKPADLPVQQVTKVELFINLTAQALVCQDESGTTWLSYNDPAFLAHRHGLGEQAKAAGTAITAALNAIATKATTPP